MTSSKFKLQLFKFIMRVQRGTTKVHSKEHCELFKYKAEQQVYLIYPLSSPAFRIMPETISPARGSRNLTPRIEPPKVEVNNTSSASFHGIEKQQVFKENVE